MDKIKILVAEDDEQIAALWGLILGDKYDVDISYDGTDALEKVEQNNYDLIISDLQMPGADGIQILRKARNKDSFVEVVIITGNATLDTAMKSINEGASSFLLKPVTPDDFLAQVEKLAAQRSFHLKNSRMQASIAENEEGKEYLQHLKELESLFQFSCHLAKTIDFDEVVRRFLVEVMSESPGSVALLFLAHDFQKNAYFCGLPPENSSEIQSLMLEKALDDWNRAVTQKRKITLSALEIKHPEGEISQIPTELENEISISLIAMGKTFAILYLRTKDPFPEEAMNYINMLTHLATPVISNAFTHNQIKILSTIDSMTGILNHRAFQEELDKEISRARRRKYSFCLVMMDVDNFKVINDTYGHPTGDVVLRSVAELVKDCIRKTDILARYGGEEFVLILPEASLEGVKVICQRILEALRGHDFRSLSGKSIKITLSMGIHQCTQEENVERKNIIDYADKALYRAKHTGKDRYVIFTPELLTTN